jgi:hypothetical protein
MSESKELKKGRISKEEDKIIQDNLDLPVDELATLLNRNVESLKEYIKKNYGHTTVVMEDRYNLQKRPFFKELRKQFSDEELDLFKYYWDIITAQFNKDVFATEEIQIVDVCKLEILMNRCLVTSNSNIERINELEATINRIESGNTILDQEEIEQVQAAERQVSVLRSSQDSLLKELRELLTKKAAMLKDMKATREQRIKRLEDSRESFPAWVSNLMQNPDLMIKYGREMEKMRLATQKEKKRLSQFHKYEDGQVDQPFLNCDTVFNDEEEVQENGTN